MAKRRDPTLPLSQCWLYAVSSPAQLADHFSTPGNVVTVAELRELAKDDGNYRLFKQYDQKGKAREIQWPKPNLQKLHKRVHILLSRVVAPDFLYSAVRGRSYISNAAAHDPAMPTIKIDVKKFFPSVSRAAVFNFFADTMRCRRDVAGLMADILTYEGHLATGSAASPIIAYYAHKKMFDEIDVYAKSLGLVMTCYVDDMALSGAQATRGTLRSVAEIIARHGLRSHKSHVFAAAKPKILTGVCNTSAGPKVPNKLHLKIKRGFDDWAQAKTVAEKKKILNPLLGRLEAAGQIEAVFKERAKTLRAQNSVNNASKLW